MNNFKHCFLFVFLVLCITACTSPQPFLQTATTASSDQTMIDEDGETHLIGVTTRQAMQKAPFQEWYQKNYTTYEVKDEVTKLRKAQIKGVEVLAFMGTWCGDSKREVPRFYKVMDKIGFEEKTIKLVNVHANGEQYKQSPTAEEKGLNIHRVPTFIFYKEGKEIGRIVESPVTSMEIDIAQILNELPTTPKYKMVARLNNLYEEEKLDFVKEKLQPFGRFTARYTTSASELNTYGYVLIARGAIEEAITTFTINTLAYPHVANTFDSLAEAYVKSDQTDLAIENYEKVLKLEPENELAKTALEKLVNL